MPEKKESEDKIDFVKWFSEVGKDSGKIVGGKGANLGEIYNLGVPVPPGFVVTAQAYEYFIEKSNLKEKIESLLKTINYENTKQLDEVTKQIRDLILKSQFPKEMEEEILESYENLDAKKSHMAEGSALDILKNSAEPIFVAVRSSATAEDLADASFAGQQDSFLNVKGESNLINHVKKCFASLYTSRATYYRNKKGFDHSKVSLAVVVQKMIDSGKSGVMFSKDPSYKNDNIIIEAVWGLGEGIVSGKITPDSYIVSRDLELLDKKIADKKIAITRDSGGNKAVVKLREEKSKYQVLKNHEIKKLAQIALELEEHYQKPQDIEFAIEGEELFIVQTRPITTIAKRIDRPGDQKIEGEVILTGLAASPGIASGKIKIVMKMEDLDKVHEKDILVTKMTNPDMVVTMQKASAIVTDDGGMTAHAAIVSREMGIPAVVGTREATTKLKEGEIITVDGYTGKIYKGKTAETEKKEIESVNKDTKTKIKVIVDLPSFAERASKTGLEAIGLTRIEGIIAESGKHPEYFLNQNKMQDYEDIIFKGVNDIAKYFEEAWIRTSDIRSDEYKNLEGAPQQKEANPMLGLHGIRYGIKKPEILKAELNALKRVSRKGKKIGIIISQLISVDELKAVKDVLKKIDFEDAKVGVMIETPAAVQAIRDLVDEGIDFISFGTNDLTQYILAVDRGNSAVQHLYNEMHPAILHQLEFVIRVCKRAKVETSICGQAGSKKEMVKFLVDRGIDSISVNADVAKEIADYVAELEKIRGDAPRQYQPEKKEIPREDNLHQEKQSEKKSEPIVENVQEAVEKIEEEKQEYLQNNHEETTPKEDLEEKPEFEKIPERNEEIGEPEEEIINDINEAVEEIKEEKQEYESKEGKDDEVLNIF